MEVDVPELKENKVLTEMEYTVVSSGTERACIMGSNNTSQKFPMSLGYCGIGRVLQIGSAVTSVSVGDRVLVYHGIHAKYNIRPEADITRVTNEDVSSLDAAFVIIASMGLGLLGIFAVQFCRLSGAYPVIAADLNPARRELALKLGADYAFDPSAPPFSHP